MVNYLKIWKQKANIELALSSKLVVGIISVILGILSIIWTPYELALNDRLNMRPGFPAFEWWLEPPAPTVYMYLYNITNGDRFINGTDSKLLMEEVGPIVYREIWKHQNIVFNNNGTMSYFVNKTLRYIPEENNIDLNATIVVPNIAVLIAVSYFWDASMLTKFGLNYLLRVLNSKPIQKMTIYDFLENNSDSLLEMAHNIAPAFAPVRNLGINKMLYRDFSDNVTTFFGAQRGHQQFALIDKYHGSVNIPGHGDSCKYKITNASEGILYNQMITKDMVIKYYRKPLCKMILIYYEEELNIYGLKVYKFSMSKDDFNRTYPIEEDCFNSYPSLPNGISDISKCLFSFPAAVSYVYFNHTDENLKTCAEIKRPPNKTIPLPYVYIEPVTGVPLVSSASLQVNLNIRPLYGFNKMFDKFSDKFVPLFWIHYYNDYIPFKIICLTHFLLLLPIIGWLLTITLFLVGMFNMWKSVKRKPENLEDKSIHGIDPKIVIELEAFLK